MFVWVSMISCEDHIFVVPVFCLGRDCSCLTDPFSPFTHYLSPFIHHLNAVAFPRYASVTGKNPNTSSPAVRNTERQTIFKLLEISWRGTVPRRRGRTQNPTSPVPAEIGAAGRWTQRSKANLYTGVD